MKKIRKKEEDGELTQGQIRQIEKARARPAPPRPAPPRPARPAVAVQGDGQARDWAEPPPFGGQDEERVKELEGSMLPQEEALALLLERRVVAARGREAEPRRHVREPPRAPRRKPRPEGVGRRRREERRRTAILLAGPSARARPEADR